MKYPKPAVSGVILNRDRKILLVRRSAKVMAPGEWCLPGGPLDGGLDWILAIKKEVMEEVNLRVLSLRLFGIYSDPKLHSLEHHGETHYFVTAAFLVPEYEGDVKLNDESDDFGWFAPDGLPKPMHRAEPVKIRDAFEFTGKVFIR